MLKSILNQLLHFVRLACLVGYPYHIVPLAYNAHALSSGSGTREACIEGLVLSCVGLALNLLLTLGMMQRCTAVIMTWLVLSTPLLWSDFLRLYWSIASVYLNDEDWDKDYKVLIFCLTIAWICSLAAFTICWFKIKKYREFLLRKPTYLEPL